MLTAYHLKLLAFSLMLVDHVGRLFFPQAHFMVALGRLSFPLFAYLIATGEKHTQSIRNYLLRLVFFGVLTQPVYVQYIKLLGQPYSQLNILFGLALGVVTIRLMRAVKNPLQKLSVVMAFSMISVAVNIEGTVNTLLTIVLMSKFQNKLQWWTVYILFTAYFAFAWTYSPITFFCLCAPVILSFYNGKQGPNSRLFYLIYPAHFLLLLGLNQMFV